MQQFALPLVVALFGASDAAPAPQSITIATPEAAGRELRPDFMVGNKCRDPKLQTAVKPGRQPRFERGPATMDMGQYIYAVDRRIDGCSVSLAMSSSILPRVELKLTPEEMAEILGRR